MTERPVKPDINTECAVCAAPNSLQEHPESGAIVVELDGVSDMAPMRRPPPNPQTPVCDTDAPRELTWVRTPGISEHVVEHDACASSWMKHVLFDLFAAAGRGRSDIVVGMLVDKNWDTMTSVDVLTRFGAGRDGEGIKSEEKDGLEFNGIVRPCQTSAYINALKARFRYVFSFFAD